MLINSRFLQHKKACVVQTTIAFIFIIIVLCALYSVSHTMAFRIIGSTSLGASTFIVFAASANASAHGKAILGGYIISGLVGLLFYLLVGVVDGYLFNEMYGYTHELFGALALASSLLLMVIFDVPHPPAAGLSVGVVVDVWDPNSFIVIAVAVIALAVLRTLLKGKLVNLV